VSVKHSSISPLLRLSALSSFLYTIFLQAFHFRLPAFIYCFLNSNLFQYFIYFKLLSCGQVSFYLFSSFFHFFSLFLSFLLFIHLFSIDLFIFINFYFNILFHLYCLNLIFNFILVFISLILLI
jgi:hypothetical protein